MADQYRSLDIPKNTGVLADKFHEMAKSPIWAAGLSPAQVVGEAAFFLARWIAEEVPADRRESVISQIKTSVNLGVGAIVSMRGGR